MKNDLKLKIRFNTNLLLRLKMECVYFKGKSSPLNTIIEFSKRNL